MDIKTIDTNDGADFERKAKELFKDGYKLSSSSCGYVGEVGGNVYDCNFWMGIFIKESEE